MFEIAGLFQNDLNSSRLSAIKSLCDYLDEYISDELSQQSLFSMQEQIYELHQIGADVLTRSAMEDRKFDCIMGCDSCCHATDVDISPAEAFYLAHHIRDEKQFHDGKQFKISPRKDKMAACPLLKEQVCTVYEARPLSCRYIMSTDLASCLKRRETLIGGAKLPAPFSHFRTSIAVACFVLFRRHGLDARWLVLDQSIEQIVNHEDACEHWLAGKPLSNSINADEAAGQFNELILAVEALS